MQIRHIQAYPIFFDTATGQCCSKVQTSGCIICYKKKKSHTHTNTHAHARATISSYSKQVHSIRLGCKLMYPRAYKTQGMCCKVSDLYLFTHVDSTGSTTGKWQKQQVGLHTEWPEQSAGHSLPLRRKKLLALVSSMPSRRRKILKLQGCMNH